jgi:hypothetical protein
MKDDIDTLRKKIMEIEKNQLGNIKNTEESPKIEKISELTNIDDDVPKIITINGKKYYNSVDLLKFDPLYFKGCVSSRNIIKKKNLSINDYIYVQSLQNIENDNEYEIADGKCKKAKLLLRKKFVDANIPKMMPNINDESINKMYDTPLAPNILIIEENEKFKDIEGNIIDIEIRGTRKHDDCYFDMYSVSDGFKLKHLQKVILNNNSGYIMETHYKYFNINKFINYENHNNKKEVFSRKMYLTYHGLVKALITSRSKNTKNFQEWATKILFTHHLGTQKQKDDLAASLIGTSTYTVKNVFRSNTNKTPVVYLFFIGYAAELLHLCTFKTPT